MTAMHASSLNNKLFATHCICNINVTVLKYISKWNTLLPLDIYWDYLDGTDRLLCSLIIRNMPWVSSAWSQWPTSGM